MLTRSAVFANLDKIGFKGLEIFLTFRCNVRRLKGRKIVSENTRIQRIEWPSSLTELKHVNVTYILFYKMQRMHLKIFQGIRWV